MHPNMCQRPLFWLLQVRTAVYIYIYIKATVVRQPWKWLNGTAKLKAVLCKLKHMHTVFCFRALTPARDQTHMTVKCGRSPVLKEHPAL